MGTSRMPMHIVVHEGELVGGFLDFDKNGKKLSLSDMRMVITNYPRGMKKVIGLYELADGKGWSERSILDGIRSGDLVKIL